MNDVRQLLLTVFIDIVHTETLCEQHIDLDGNEGILFAKYVPILNVEFRTVECSFVNTNGVLDAEFIEDVAHDALCSSSF